VLQCVMCVAVCCCSVVPCVLQSNISEPAMCVAVCCCSVVLSCVRDPTSVRLPCVLQSVVAVRCCSALL